MDYILHLATLIVIYGVFSITANFIIGYVGILHLAHPAVYGIGAYTYALLSINGFGFFPALILSGFLASIAGIILIIPAIRLKSHYIGMATLGFLLITNNLLINLRDLTRGARGIPGIPRPEIFGYSFDSNLSFFLLSFVICGISAIILHRVLHSPFSTTVEALREDETALKTLGKNTTLIKAKSFLIATFFAGIAGGLLASYLQFITPWNFTVHELITLLAMIIVGGLASFWGSILGAAIIILLPEPLRYLDLSADIVGAIRYGSYGLLIIAFMIFKPTGLLGRRTKEN